MTEIYARARGDAVRWHAAQLVPIVRGEFLFHNARSEYDKALVLAAEMLALAEAADSKALEGGGPVLSPARRTCCGANSTLAQRGARSVDPQL